ncbi:hypothetical protein ONA70_10385 [Micromonospora yasonensis]|uniref:FIMAH domain-containing protein n=1 Tax=Micromonospora yasonensis TaxID=1128667 RepID=UPI00222E972B|nr:hypothetical protein [Micromonospora yasonensis]MCW3840502.1 hypothetical protein [Micromonospora yasonensis]
MSGVSSTPNSPDSPDLVPPTTSLPLVRGRARHRAVTDGRRLMWATVAGAAVTVVAAAVVVATTGDGDPERPGPGPVIAQPSGTDSGHTTDVAVTDEASASPSPSPSPKASTARPVRPTDLIKGMQATIDWLVRERQMSDDAGDELRGRLREVEEAIADDDLDKAREKLREFAEKLARLRKKDRISGNGYNTLAAGAGQLAQALTNR